MSHQASARHIVAAALLAAAAAYVPGLAAAQSADDTAAPATGNQANLATVCPGAESALQDALASAWRRVGYPSTVTVQLRVEGRQVEVTQVSGGLMPYRHAVSRAAGRLDCDSQGSGSRTVAFNVRFVGPDELQAAPQLASR